MPNIVFDVRYVGYKEKMKIIENILPKNHFPMYFTRERKQNDKFCEY